MSFHCITNMSFTVSLAAAVCLTTTLVVSLLLPILSSQEGLHESSLRKAVRFLVRRLRGLLYLVSGPQIIDQAYASANGNPFAVPTPTNDHLMITSSDLIAEVVNAPYDSLSLHAVAKEILQPQHTMIGFEWQNQRGVEGTGFVRALRSLLTSQLPRLQPELNAIIRKSLNNELYKADPDELISVRLSPMIKRIVTEVNCFVFFGEDLSKTPEFTAAALDFPQVVIFAAEFLRITPAFLRPLVAKLTTSRHRAAKTLFRHLEPIVRQRLNNRANADTVSEAKSIDCMQWLIDTSPRKNPWSPARMIGEIMAVWFSTIHQLAMTTTYVIQDLCLHGEYITPLRREVHEHVAARADAAISVEELPLLDSFIKESVRYTNTDAISCRRKALRDYIFQDGSRVKRGDWVCVPQRAMMHDKCRYSDSHQFEGFRFARANRCLRAGKTTSEVPDKSPANLTTVNLDWPIWGLGKTACPGRFYASLVLKLIVLQILDEWECTIPEMRSPRSMVWRTSVVPRDDTVVMFRRRLGKSPIVRLTPPGKSS